MLSNKTFSPDRLKGSGLISYLRNSRDKLQTQKSPQGLRRAGS
jgi:hypothetical protein